MSNKSNFLLLLLTIVAASLTGCISITERQGLSPGCLADSCHAKMDKHIASVTVPHGEINAHNCVVCHTDHDAKKRSSLRKPLDRLCYSCHDEFGSRIQRAKFSHTPVQKKECNLCHHPHGSNYRYLLRLMYVTEWEGGDQFDQGRTQLCWNCHEKKVYVYDEKSVATAFRDGDRNLHFLHVVPKSTRACFTCHDAHASDQEFHIRRSIPFGGAGMELPIEFVRKETGGNCTVGCHKPFAYSRNGLKVIEPVAHAVDERVPVCLKQLKSDDAKERRSAVFCLGMHGDQSVIKPLLESLDDPQVIVRAEAARALGRLKVEEAVGLLVLGLKDPEIDVRRGAVAALTKIGAPAAPMLIETLGDADWHARANAAILLGRIEYEEARKPLAALLHDRDDRVAVRAASSLVRLGDERVFDTLLAYLKHPEFSIREVAISSLSKERNPRLVETLLQMAIDTDPDVAYRAKMILRSHNYPDAVRLILLALSNEIADMRIAAAFILGKMETPEAVEALIVALDDSETAVRIEAVYALAKIGDRRGYHALLILLEDEDEGVRGTAVKAMRVLAKAGDAEAVSPLLRALEDEQYSIRQDAALVLGAIGDPRAIDPLLKAYAATPKTGEGSITNVLPEALGRIGGPRVVLPLCALLGDGTLKHNSEALRTLQKMDQETVIRELITGLESDDQTLREDARKGLLRLGYPTDIDALVEQQ